MAPEISRIEAAGHTHEIAWYGPGACEDSGQRTAKDGRPVLVFLHHGLGCVATWKDFPARLGAALDCRAFAYSRLGYGGSDPVAVPRPVSFLHDEGRLVLPQILAAAGISDFVLIGHSDGGTTSIAYAGLVGNGPGKPRLRALVTEAGHVDASFINFDAIRAARKAWPDGKLRRALAPYQGDNVDNAFGVWSQTWLQPGAEKFSLDAALPGVRVPWLAMIGRDDEYADPAQFDWIRSRVSGDFTAEQPDCGHAPHEEVPDVMVARMADFIRPQI